MMKKCFTSFLLILFLGSFGQQEGNDEANLLELARYLKIEIPKSKYLIILGARLPCEYCEDKFIEFVKHNYQEKIAFVLPFISEKQLKIDYSEHVLKRQNIIVDYQNYAAQKGLVFQNTVIYYLVDKQVVKKVQLTPENIEAELQKIASYSQNIR